MVNFFKLNIANKNYSILLYLILTFTFFYNVILNTWISEDGYIFFRYVNNLLEGYGPVFNIGQRVEGFTSPLWLYLLYFLKHFTGLNINLITIFLSYALSIASIFILSISLFHKNHLGIIGFIILLSTDFIFDFSTSGFETPLIIFLTIAIALIIKNKNYDTNIYLFSFLVSLSILTRPEFGILFIIFFFYYSYKSFKEKTLILFKFLFFPLITIFPYQIFRMYYYVSVFPNTYYEKKSSIIYIDQGINYFTDFFNSYKITSILLIIFFIINLIKFFINKNFNSLFIVLIPSCFCLYLFFSGGGYMHGRLFLIPFLFFCVLNFNYYLKFENLFSFIFALLLYFLLISQVPITSKYNKQINFINNERDSFFGDFDTFQFFDLLSGEIPNSYGWRDRGFYYKELSEKINVDLKIHFPNIGYFSVASGSKISLIGPLIDFYRSKFKVNFRGRIGHEGDNVLLPYIFDQKPHFSYIPYIEWRDVASFKVDNLKYSSVIKDFSDDSLLPVLNLEDRRFINNFSNEIGIDILAKINEGIADFLKNFDKDIYLNNEVYYTDFFGFLESFWLPYTTENLKHLFYTKKNVLNMYIVSKQAYFELCHKSVSEKFNQRVKNKLFLRDFYNNIRLSFDSLSNDMINNYWLSLNNKCNNFSYDYFFKIDLSNLENKSIDINKFQNDMIIPFIIKDENMFSYKVYFNDISFIKINPINKWTNDYDLILDIALLKKNKIEKIIIKKIN